MLIAGYAFTGSMSLFGLAKLISNLIQEEEGWSTHGFSIYLLQPPFECLGSFYPE